MRKLVVRGLDRKYYRFRPDRWYGGIATADAVGCGLFCKFCWVSDRVRSDPAGVGTFYSPESVAKRLIAIASSRGFNKVRISGGEPTIGRHHLLAFLEKFRRRRYTFVLETNGILVGLHEDYATDLSKFPFVNVRVSFKGCSAGEFHLLTGAKPSGFGLQFEAVKNLVNAGVSCWAAVMASFSTRDAIQRLIDRLILIDESLARAIEIEELILYPKVEARLRKEGIKYNAAYKPYHRR